MHTRLLVSETMERDPLVEPGATSIMDAARDMRERGTGCVLIYNSHGLEGILTERDILHKVVAEGLDPVEVRVSDIMTRGVLTLGPDDTIIDALRLMKARNIRRLPVVDGDRLLGLVTEHGIAQVAPELIEIADDWATITHNGNATPGDGYNAAHGYREVRTVDMFPGACELCGNMDTDLMEANGSLVCTECLEAELESGGPTSR